MARAKPVHEVSLQFSNYPIRIEFLKSLKDQDNPDEQLYGYTDPDSHVIQINVKLHSSLEQLQRTIFHELFHAYIFFTGHRNSLKSDDAEEALIVMLEHQMFWLVDKQHLTQVLELDKVKKYLGGRKPS